MSYMLQEKDIDASIPRSKDAANTLVALPDRVTESLDEAEAQAKSELAPKVRS